MSGYLSQGDMNSLEGLVTPEVISEIKKSLSQFNMAQRQQLAIIEDDIYFSFPYEIGVIFPNEDGKFVKFDHAMRIEISFFSINLFIFIIANSASFSYI